MDTYASLEDLPLQRIWVGVVAGVVEGDRMSFAVVELAPNSIVARHQHPNEQIGLVLRGTLTFTIAGERRLLAHGRPLQQSGRCPARRRDRKRRRGRDRCVRAGASRLGSLHQGTTRPH